MKLIYAIVSNDDSSAVSQALAKAGFFSTKLSSTGGFLMAGNTTIIICTEDDTVDNAMEIIGNKSRKRKQLVPSVAAYGMGGCTPFPVEVTVGGATIIVVNVDRFEKI